MQSGEQVPGGLKRASPFDLLTTRGLMTQIALFIFLALVVAMMAFPAVRQKANVGFIMVLTYVVTTAVIGARGRFAHLQWRKVFGSAPRISDLPLLAVIVPLALVTAGALILVFVPLSYVAPEVVEQMMLSRSGLEDIHTTAQLAITVFVMVVGAPVVEELLFRGIILQRLAHKWGTATAVVASSMLFALLHAEWIGHFATGAALALIYIRTRSLWMGMITHGAYNALFAFPMAWSFLRGEKETTTTLAEFRSTLGPGALALCGGSLLLWFYLDLYWPDGRAASTLAGPVPYEADGASTVTGTEDSTSVS